MSARGGVSAPGGGLLPGAGGCLLWGGLLPGGGGCLLWGDLLPGGVWYSSMH